MNAPQEQKNAEQMTVQSAPVSAGLSTAEATRLLAEVGPNALEDRGGRSPWMILFDQFKSTMVLILVAAAMISATIGDAMDTVVILVIVAANTALGFSQEFRAEKAMAALKRMIVPTVKARRDGRDTEIPARELVPGDVVLLESGDLVPADGRVTKSSSLFTQESALTGESHPVPKDARQRADAESSDHGNLVFQGTIVSSGRGEILISSTGMNTELGRIASMMQSAKSEPTPLQARLDHLGRILAAAALVIVSVIFGIGLFSGENLQLMFLTAVSLGVAAVPEGLPAVVTVALALGTQRMLRRGALIRKLPAVETLGAVTIICTDKTGTLTENVMTVTELDIAGNHMRIPAADGTPESDKVIEALREHPGFALLIAGAALCNNAWIDEDPNQEETRRYQGDPTETALLRAAARLGIRRSALDEVFPRVEELPFDSDRKLMTTIHRIDTTWVRASGPLEAALENVFRDGSAAYISFTKGAVDRVVSASTHIWERDTVVPITASLRGRIRRAEDSMASRGTRVLGVGFRLMEALPKSPESEVEGDLVFIGLMGLTDPPRREAVAAVKRCKSAGIRPVMITGDHPLTALQIAREVGICADEQPVTGSELARLYPDELGRLVESRSVFARVSPEDKFRIVEALQLRGHVVAMTGDGVNDAPALKRADAGVAMGVTGTDVSKEAADIVLLDDNFATIVAAVEEGRVIYDNIRKFVRYLLTTNSAEIWVMLLSPFLGMPMPLLPLQILWINMVTDGPPALALGFENAEPNIMERPPRKPGESILAGGAGRHVLLVGFMIGALSLAVGYWNWAGGRVEWQTMLFTTLTLSQMAQVLAIRSETESLWSVGIWTNWRLNGAVAITFILQVGVIYLPPIQPIFRTHALSAGDFAVCMAASGMVFLAVEIEKIFIRRAKVHRNRADASQLRAAS